MIKSKKGFTLVELLAVIIILAIIITIATLSVIKTVRKNRTKAFNSTMEVAVGMAKNMLISKEALTVDNLKSNLGIKNDNDYNIVVGNITDGYTLTLTPNTSGKFKNINLNEITQNDDFYYEEKLISVKIIVQGKSITLEPNSLGT